MRKGIALIFVALLAAPLIYKRIEAGNNSRQPTRYGFHFEESARAAGIDFKHSSPVLDAKLSHIMPQVASMGAAVSVVDFDRDGWPDIYLTNSGAGTHNALYRNQHDGTFRDVASDVGLAELNAAGTGASMGAVWGDYDNDGYEDVLIYKWGRPELFHNDAGKKFTRVTETAGLPAWVNANAAVWFDYDGDGRLDLFLGGYYPETVDLWHLTTTRIMPESFEYAQNGGRKYLFHNLGGGRFEEVSEKLGIASRRWTLAATAADLRGTGYPDLFVANDYGVSELYLNDRGKGFHEAGKETGIGFAPKSGMSAAAGDVLNDGRLGVYVSNISEEGVLVQGNNFWVPQPNGQYENMATAMGVAIAGWSFGVQFGDFNNDGFEDLYVTNGNVSLDRGKNYWYDYSKVAGGNKSIISDAANWPPMNGRSLSGYQRKKLFLNDGAGQFREVAQLVGIADVYDGRSVALGDFGNRGLLDAVVANQNGPALLYRNSVDAANHWVEFELQGSYSNRSAIGAGVRLFWGGRQQLQEVSGGSGFCAQNDRRLHFGIGTAAHIDKVVIRWPSGKLQTILSPDADRIHRVKEPA